MWPGITISYLFLIILCLDEIVQNNAQRRNSTTTRPVTKRVTQRTSQQRRTKAPSSAKVTTWSSGTMSSTPAVASSHEMASISSNTTVPMITPTDSPVTSDLESNFSKMPEALSPTKATINAVLVMIVEVKGNESLIDQIENANLNISSIPKAKSTLQSRQASITSSSPTHRLTSAPRLPHVILSHRPLLPDTYADDLSGHESHPSVNFKYVNKSSTRTDELSVSKCWFHGPIRCEESQPTCSGFGEIDCHANGRCVTSPTLTCNMDLRQAKCSGRGSCRPGLESSAEFSISTMSLLAMTIVVVAISCGVLVLAATAIYVYLSTFRHKVGPQAESRSDSSSNRQNMIHRLTSMGTNVYHHQ